MELGTDLTLGSVELSEAVPWDAVPALSLALQINAWTRTPVPSDPSALHHRYLGTLGRMLVLNLGTCPYRDGASINIRRRHLEPRERHA